MGRFGFPGVGVGSGWPVRRAGRESHAAGRASRLAWPAGWLAVMRLCGKRASFRVAKLIAPLGFLAALGWAGFPAALETTAF